MTRHNSEVDAWFEAFQGPLKAEMQRVRAIILDADERITEAVKWQTPTFIHKGNIASFNPKSKAHVSLMFHSGAEIPGSHALLEGEGKQARTARFLDMADIDAKRTRLQAVIRAWIAHKEADG